MRAEPTSSIIWMMTLDEFQYLQLEIAREVGAERGFHVQLAEQEDLHDAGFEAKPMGMRRWGFFRRRQESDQYVYDPGDPTPSPVMLGNEMESRYGVWLR